MAFFSTAARNSAVSNAVREVCQDVLGGGLHNSADDSKTVDGSEDVPSLAYAPKMVEAALPRLCQRCVEEAQKIDEAKQFKFVASVVLAENIGSGLHKGSAALWNSETDSSCVVRWESSSLIVVVTIFALAV